MFLGQGRKMKLLITDGGENEEDSPAELLLWKFGSALCDFLVYVRLEALYDGSVNAGWSYWVELIPSETENLLN